MTENQACSRCGATFPAQALMTYQRAKFCAPCKRDYFQHLAQGTLIAQNMPPHYFVRRAMAKMVDGNLTILFHFAVSATLSPIAPSPDETWPWMISLGLTVAIFLAGSAIPTASMGGTPGKRLFHLQVVYRDGVPLRPAGAFLRAVSELVSIACFGLGYFISDQEGTRRTLHDRLCGTVVVAQRGDWPWTR